MVPPLEFKHRVKLPDALPELDFAPPRGRSRRTILLWGSLAWALATALGWGLLQRYSNQSQPTLDPGLLATRAPRSTESTLAAAAPTRQVLPAATHSSGSIEPAPLLPSCEAALAQTNTELTHSDYALPRDMTGTDYGALLDGPTARAALKHCAGTKPYRVELCVTVLGVRAVGVSADTEPESAAVSACLNRSIGAMRFPHQPRPQLLRSHITL